MSLGSDFPELYVNDDEAYLDAQAAEYMRERFGKADPRDSIPVAPRLVATRTAAPLESDGDWLTGN